jgi:hypothetical protein
VVVVLGHGHQLLLVGEGAHDFLGRGQGLVGQGGRLVVPASEAVWRRTEESEEAAPTKQSLVERNGEDSDAFVSRGRRKKLFAISKIIDLFFFPHRRGAFVCVGKQVFCEKIGQWSVKHARTFPHSIFCQI